MLVAFNTIATARSRCQTLRAFDTSMRKTTRPPFSNFNHDVHARNRRANKAEKANHRHAERASAPYPQNKISDDPNSNRPAVIMGRAQTRRRSVSDFLHGARRLDVELDAQASFFRHIEHVGDALGQMQRLIGCSHRREHAVFRLVDKVEVAHEVALHVNAQPRPEC